MDFKYSFEYVFYDLLQVIDDNTIIYQHKLDLLIETEDEMAVLSGYQWDLDIVKFMGCKSSKELSQKTQICTKRAMQNFKEDSISLSTFLDFFINEIEKRIRYFRNFIDYTIKLEELLESKEVTLIYKGYLPFDEHDNLYHYYEHGEKNIKKADHDQNDYPRLQQIIIYYLEKVISPLDKLNLFLKHQKNLHLTQKEQLSNKKGSEIYLNLIWEAQLSELFKKISKDKEFDSNIEMIQLSARYFSLERDKEKDLINREDYRIEFSNLVSSLLSVITRED